jgi:GeoRSP system SPASM domain protein
MSLDLLDTPVRLTWDLHGPDGLPGTVELLAIAERIVAGGVFYLTLEERPLAHPALAPLLDRLLGGGCRLLVTCRGTDEELAALERLAPPLPAVELEVAPFVAGPQIDAARLQRVLDRLRRAGSEATLRLTPLRSNLQVISKILLLCRELGVGRFKLPNARIGDTFRACPAVELPRWQDLEAFRQSWAAAALPAAALPALEIHDRFLWEIMTPANEQARSEYGGCQAANSLGHVDAHGTVYACAAWPEPLGTLCSAPLEQIWQSPRRFAVRERIGQVPSGCGGCRDYPACWGGCRGLGERLNPTGGGRDLMCRGPRS